jgi:DNA (cytosine-5)-methyltransferase 1
MVFHEVCADLENIGYEVQAFIIPASGINAPHQRERLWIVAHTVNYNRRSAQSRWDEKKEYLFSESKRFSKECFTANTDNTRTKQQVQSNGEWKENDEQRRGQSQSEHWENGINGNVTNSQNYGRKTNERINNGTKYKSNDRDTIRNIFNTDGKQRDVADTESQRTWEQSSENRGREDGRFNDISEDGNAPDTDSIRLERECGPIGELEREIRFSSTSSRNMWDTAWDNFPTESPVCGGDDGISHGLDNITFSKWRNESIKGYGNAVVPQVVYRIFKTIEYIQNLNDNTKSKN